MIKHDLQCILRNQIPLKLFTDHKHMFDVITRASHTPEKRLMIKVAAARETYRNFEISYVGLVAGTVHPADSLTKPKPCPLLLEIMRNVIDTTPVDQWVIRKQ